MNSKPLNIILISLSLALTWLGVWLIIGEPFLTFSLQVLNLLKIVWGAVFYIALLFATKVLGDLLSKVFARFEVTVNKNVLFFFRLAFASLFAAGFYILFGEGVTNWMLAIGGDIEKMSDGVTPSVAFSLVLLFANVLMPWALEA